MKAQTEVVSYNSLVFTVNFNFDSKVIHIYDSHKLTNKQDIKKFLKVLAENPLFETLRANGFTRTIKSLVHEWAAHNWLYEHNYKPEHTGDVDLNQDESPLRKISYFFISLLYR